MKASRESARSFTVTEEAFFEAGQRPEPTEPIETFEDLEIGYQRVSLWQRLLGRKPR